MALLVLSATCPVLPDAGEGRPLEAALAGEPGSDTAWGLAHRQPSQPDPWFVRVVSDGFLPLPLFSLRALPNDNLVHSRRRERERETERERQRQGVWRGGTLRLRFSAARAAAVASQHLLHRIWQESRLSQERV